MGDTEAERKRTVPIRESPTPPSQCHSHSHSNSSSNHNLLSQSEEVMEDVLDDEEKENVADALNSSHLSCDDDYVRASAPNSPLKEAQRMPAHLNASDEELRLLLQNPPAPPVPFYCETQSEEEVEEEEVTVMGNGVHLEEAESALDMAAIREAQRGSVLDDVEEQEIGRGLEEEEVRMKRPSIRKGNFANLSIDN